MSDDLVERLRTASSLVFPDGSKDAVTAYRAADRIERLHDALSNLIDLANDALSRLDSHDREMVGDEALLAAEKLIRGLSVEAER
jgi:hypothetical protein